MFDIDIYTKTYFAFDEPVHYQIENKTLLISPILLKDSEVFLSSVNILTVDKNSLSSPEIIQMSYLQFLFEYLCLKESNLHRIVNILYLCLDMKNPIARKNDFGKYELYDKEKDIAISAKKFDEIKKIILYQNFPHYDDEYINPELKKNMEEMDRAKSKGYVQPSLERKMAIITAHCGISKKEQMSMTMRAHNLLFEEIVGEVEFTTIRPIALYTGQADKFEHWIYKKKKDKFDGYIMDVDTYTNKMGGEVGAIKTSTDTSYGDKLMNQFDNFYKGGN